MTKMGLNLRLAGMIAAVGLLFSACANRVSLEPAFFHSSQLEKNQPDFTKEPHLVWSIKLPAEPSAQLALSGNLVAIPLKNRSVWFVNKGTGEKLGVYDLSGVPAGVVFDGRENILIAEKSGNGELISYSLVEGEADWHYALNEAGEMPILRRGETDPFGTVLSASRGGGVHALRADDGKLLWSLQQRPLSCPPVGADTVFWLADFEGELNACANGKIVKTIRGASAILALEAAGEKLFAGGGDSSFSCFSSDDGKLLWRHKTDGKVRSLAVGNALVFFSSTAGTVVACSVSNGAKLWERKLENLVNGSLLAAGGAVLVGTAEARFFALSEKNGEILWERRLSGAPVGRPVLEGNTLFFATHSRRVLAFRF